MIEEVVEVSGTPDHARLFKRGEGTWGVMDDLTAGNYNASGLAEPQVWTLLRLATYPS